MKFLRLALVVLLLRLSSHARPGRQRSALDPLLCRHRERAQLRGRVRDGLPARNYRQPKQLRGRRAIFHRALALGCRRARQLASGLQSGLRPLHGRALIRGPENFYYGISSGSATTLPSRGRVSFPTFRAASASVGSTATRTFSAQGQDFTFNILTATGVSYQVNDHLKLNAGILYQHFSNGGQTDPNPSVNLLGPQLGVTYTF